MVLFLLQEVPHLILHFPAKFITTGDKPQFLDTMEKDWRKNPGRTANMYHTAFTSKIKENSLSQIYSAILLGAECKEHNGFHARNNYVAKSEYLIAFTWSESGTPKKGSGTYDTWKKCKGTKVHIPLTSLVSSNPHDLGTASTSDDATSTTKVECCKSDTKSDSSSSSMKTNCQIEPTDVVQSTKTVKRRLSGSDDQDSTKKQKLDTYTIGCSKIVG